MSRPALALVLPKSLLNLAPRRLSFRHVLFSAVATIFCFTLYYTADPDRLAHAPLYTGIAGPDDNIPEEWLHRLIPDQPRVTTPDEWMSRAEQVKQAFAHAYHGYETHAFPHDELKPLTNRTYDK